MRERKLIKGLVVLLAMLFALLACGCSSELKKPDEYNYDMSQYIKVAEYKDLHYQKEQVTVSNAELQQEINDTLEEYKTTENITSGTVQADSVINIDYVGSMNGKEFDGGSAEGTSLDMSNNNFIAGFSDSIIGHKVGETFDINVTFPEDYSSEELAGKPAVFKITVNYIEKEVVPQYTEDWVKQNTDYDNKVDYEKNVMDELKAEKEKQAESDTRNKIFTSIVDNSEVTDYPETELATRVEQYRLGFEPYAKQSGVELDDFIKDQLGMSKKEFNKQAKATAKNSMKSEMVLVTIAEQEGIEITDTEYDEYLMDMLSESGYTKDSFEEANEMTIQEYADRSNLYYSMLYSKVMDKVMEYSISD